MEEREQRGKRIVGEGKTRVGGGTAYLRLGASSRVAWRKSARWDFLFSAARNIRQVPRELGILTREKYRGELSRSEPSPTAGFASEVYIYIYLTTFAAIIIELRILNRVLHSFVATLVFRVDDVLLKVYITKVRHIVPIDPIRVRRTVRRIYASKREKKEGKMREFDSVNPTILCRPEKIFW